jgi:hypothetical protein
MKGSIDFGKGAKGADGRWEVLASSMETAMRKALPHVVCWETLREGEPAVVYLPSGMRTDDLVPIARREMVDVGTDYAGRNVLKLHFEHMEPSEVEEGIERLGRAIVTYLHYAHRHSGVDPLLFVGP